MQQLKDLSKEEQELIKIKVAGSKLYLQARSFNRNFEAVMKGLLRVSGKKYTLELTVLIASAISALKLNDLGLSYTRDKGKYLAFNNKQPKGRKSSYRRTLDLFEILEDTGYIENFVGFKDVENNQSMPAIILFTDKFIDLFDKNMLVQYGEVIPQPEVIIKDSQGIILKNTKEAKSKEEVVREINNWLSTHTFNFGVLDKVFNLQRIFKYNKLATALGAGRFYFGALQTIRKGKRRLFKIDGCPVTERDIVSNHMMLIAELEGVILPEGFRPYSVDVSDLITCEDESKIRPLLKFCCMLLINSGSSKASFTKAWKSNLTLIDKEIKEGNWNKAQENLFYGISGIRNAKKVVERVAEHNAYANKYFNVKSGSWDRLQLLDSEIMLETMLMMRAVDKPLIPYHDSAVCKEQDGDYLEYCISTAWKKIIGTNHNCILTKKY